MTGRLGVAIDANTTDDPDRPVGPGRSVTGDLLTAEDVADAVVTAVARGRDQVFPGRTARLAHLAHRLAPRLYGRAMVRRLRG